MLKCNCYFCEIYDKYRWAVISDCKCGCHNDDDVIGHDSLCCEFPNGKKKDSPYKKLKASKHYKKLLDVFINA